MSDGASSINVCVRVRPFTIKEAAQISHAADGPLFLGEGSLAGAPPPRLIQKGIRSVIKVVDDKCLVFDPPEDNPIQKFSRAVLPQGRRVKDQTFGFDTVFDENATQGDVYEGTTKTLLDSVLDGYNATVFAYGATGCGKTHTITGTHQHPGIIFLTMQELFERIGETSSEKVSEISLSYLEIYNETIRDLLVPSNSTGRNGLALREDANQAVSVSGLSSHHPQNVQEVMDILVRGNELRTMSPTEANATSSRSHAVLQINISQKDRNADINEPHTMATLSIIDLAGSERASATKNRGERLIEGANINKSLLALGSCINALCDPRKKNHVPYRNSKLTRLLKFSLGGNCKTVMIVCVSPSSAHFDETQNTLRYANRAKNIQTKVTRNVFNVNRHVKDYLVKIDEQRAQIDELKQKLKDHENVAFTKFRKQTEKKDVVAREGVTRIRKAFDDSASERMDKLNYMKRLKQIERRIAMISAWIAAFDEVQDAQEDDSLLQNLVAMRKTGQGIVLELENSRHHYHQKMSKSNWERAIDSALQSGLRQLKELDSTVEGADSANLHREVELLKANAEREALVAVAEQDKGSESAMVEVLVKAHFETMAAVQHLMSMDEDEAVQSAKRILSRIFQSSMETTSHIVQPNAKIAPIESFPPTKSGTPKRKKQVSLFNSTPLKTVKPLIAQEQQPMSGSPMRLTPKRRKLGGAKKGVSFTPKKKSPAKVKRGVRWRDDTEDGTLAEYAKTPQKLDSTPDMAPAEATFPMGPPSSSFLPSSPDGRLETDSSPILPPPPEPSLDIKPAKSDRFRSGFLSKKSNGSPIPPRMTRLSSESERSEPLRDLEPSKVGNRASLNKIENINLSSSSPLTADLTVATSKLALSSSSGTNDENNAAAAANATTTPPTSDSENNNPLSSAKWKHASKSDIQKVKSELLHRRSSPGSGPSGLSNHAASAPRRRRSPRASSNSPPTSFSSRSRHVSHGGAGGTGGSPHGRHDVQRRPCEADGRKGKGEGRVEALGAQPEERAGC
ncbi:MAG: hypothetical protein LQ340_005601 [Diploschistes diacapsis]|nr:MAG: hypothetical protein LQ340_005601 [Diploschistes diacapsis]